MNTNLVFCIISLLLLTAIVVSCSDNNDTSNRSNVAQSLSGDDTQGFARADAPLDFTFPKDFGPHPDFQTEWWYYTGNLSTKEGRDFGYQLTFFRRALNPDELIRESAWASNQIYFAHFALSDIENEEFYSSERWSRGAAGLAGSQNGPFRVWIDNWSISGDETKINLKAYDEEFSIEMSLESLKPIVLQGDKGLSQKSSGEGNASYYFSQTRIQSSGTISINEESYSVGGLSWLDREWSTSVLGEDQVGWDWFSIQLDDGREIMLYQLRLKDGGVDQFSSGSFIEKDGRVKHLKSDDFEIEVLDTWKSSETGITYPSKWKVTIPEQDIEIIVTPRLNNQELLLTFTYWEGAVKVSGEGVSGKGYVELTGYKSQD